MKFLESARCEGGFALGCHVIGDGELLLLPLSLSAIRCVREIWTGKWGIRNQSCAWNVDYPQANWWISNVFLSEAEFRELLSLQISPITCHEMDVVVIRWIPGVKRSEPKTNG
jgi:hypothetical protein